MVLEDEEKTIFITTRSLFYYRVMNFKDQIEWNMEVYMDDMLVKSRALWTYVKDLKEMFATLLNY